MFQWHANLDGLARARVWIPKQYTHKELQIATDNFDPKNMIGQGAFGPVFKGMLDDGTLVAIKLLSPLSEQGDPQFLKEIEVLSKIKHENLVKLYGSCTEGNCRMLVYEYLENNSLAKSLLGAHSNKLQFTWKIRSQICLGVAQGLHFLHEARVVHRDLKASNVVLGKNFTPKIVDFGMARIFPNSVTHINTFAAGTPGYMAPEYVLTGTLTKKSDVYSYGILLLEIVSGRRNGDVQLPDEEQYLLAWAWTLYKKGELVLLVDEALRGGSAAAEACKYLKVGLLCAQEQAKKRPTVSDVVKMLKGDINVDKIKMPKPGKLIAYFAENSSTYQPHASLLGSCFCFR